MPQVDMGIAPHTPH